MLPEDFVKLLTPEQATAFNATLITYRDAQQVMFGKAEQAFVEVNQRLAAEIEAAKTLHATEISTITKELADTKASHATEIESVTTELAATVATLESVKAQIPWDVRSIDAKHFQERFDKYDIKILYGVSDKPVQQFLEWLKQQEGSISLDAPEITDYFTYLVESEYIKPDRVKELTKDSMKDEQ